MYDYGYQINQKLYGNSVPPEYPVEKIITPTYLIYSKHDSVATSEVCLRILLIYKVFLFPVLGCRTSLQ